MGTCNGCYAKEEDESERSSIVVKKARHDTVDRQQELLELMMLHIGVSREARALCVN